MFAAAQDRRHICSKVTSTPAIDIITRSGYCSARRSSTAGTVNDSTPKSEGPKGPLIRLPAGLGGGRVRLTLGGVPEIGRRGLHAPAEASRPAAHAPLARRLCRGQIG